ncbi:MAG: hypothetical protein IPM48_04875 [Saprospiraceae bacterium]|nr:hypothetical protein [Saprospiraceae bacterium]
MSFDNRDHITDRLFKDRLDQLDLGPQKHLWDGIEKALDAEQSNRKIFGLPWFTNLIIGLSLVSFSLLAAYKYGYHAATKKMESIHQTKAEPVANEIDPEATMEIIPTQRETENGPDSKESSLDIGIEQEKLGIVKDLMATGQKKTPKGSLEKTKALDNDSFKDISDTEKEINVSNKDNKALALGDLNENKDDLTHSFSKEGEMMESGSIHWNTTASREKIETVESIPSRPWMVGNSKRKKPVLRGHIKDDPCNLVQRFVKRDKIYLDFYYAPEISKRTIEAVYPNSLEYADKRNTDEKFIKAYSMGIRGSYAFKNGLALRTGFNYSEIKERFDFVSETQLIQIIRKDDQGNPIDTVHQEVDIIENIYNRYKFYDVPFVMGYEMDLADFLFSVNAGVAVNLMTRRSGFIYMPNGKDRLNLEHGASEGNQYFKNNVGMSLVGSFGLNYKMSRGLMLLAEPSVRYYLGSITTDKYPLKQNYIQFGLIAGLRYQFVR